MNGNKDNDSDAGNKEHNSFKQRIDIEISPELDQAVGKFLNDNWRFPEPSASLEAKVLQTFQDRYSVKSKSSWKDLFSFANLSQLFTWPSRDNFSLQYVSAIAIIVSCLLGFMLYKLTSNALYPEMVAIDNKNPINNLPSPPTYNGGSSTNDPKSTPTPNNTQTNPTNTPTPTVKATPRIKNTPPPNNTERGINNSLNIKNIKRVYVAPAVDEWQTSFRTEFINRLSSINNWQIVNSLGEADAIFKISIASGKFTFITVGGEIIWQSQIDPDKSEPQAAANKLLKDLASRIK